MKEKNEIKNSNLDSNGNESENDKRDNPGSQDSIKEKVIFNDSLNIDKSENPIISEKIELPDFVVTPEKKQGRHKKDCTCDKCKLKKSGISGEPNKYEQKSDPVQESKNLETDSKQLSDNLIYPLMQNLTNMLNASYPFISNEPMEIKAIADVSTKVILKYLPDLNGSKYQDEILLGLLLLGYGVKTYSNYKDYEKNK